MRSFVSFPLTFKGVSIAMKVDLLSASFVSTFFNLMIKVWESVFNVLAELLSIFLDDSNIGLFHMNELFLLSFQSRMVMRITFHPLRLKVDLFFVPPIELLQVHYSVFVLFEKKRAYDSVSAN